MFIGQAPQTRFKWTPVCNITTPSITTFLHVKTKGEMTEHNVTHRMKDTAGLLSLVEMGFCVWLKMTEGLKNRWSVFAFVYLKYHYCGTFCWEGARLISFWGAPYWSFRAIWCRIWRFYLLADIRVQLWTWHYLDKCWNSYLMCDSTFIKQH